MWLDVEAPRRADLVGRVAARVRALRALGGGDAPARFRERVRRLVVVASSSRGGSTIFSELLRRSPRLLHFSGEVNPFLVLAGRTFPESGTGSDALDESHAAGADALADDLALDCGNPAGGLGSEAERRRFAIDLACRLSIQWPAVEFDMGDVERAAAEALAALRAEEGWAPGEFRDDQPFHAAFLGRLRRRYPEVNPHHYDLDRALIARFSPDAPPPAGPPGPAVPAVVPAAVPALVPAVVPTLVIEEPPFVTIRPWRRPTEAELDSRWIVVKTPSNAYRLPFLRALFPRAEMRVLHLVRNVAASVNGLYDGWRSSGFFSHRVPARLAIRGYSDRFPWGDAWWKFDLPPGWAAFAERPLADVCAFQWRSAHEAALGWLGETGAGALRVRFEDVIGPETVQRAAFGRIADWLGVPLDEPLAAAAGRTLRPVMATERPRARRWFDRADELESVLRDSANRRMMERLGYENDPATWI